ncbi:MAG: GAF domain-containing protein, partial [Candidatus Methylomirabilota bacterium]
MPLSAERLHRALDAVRLLSAETELGALAAQALRLSCELLGAERGTVYLVDKAEGGLRSVAAQGLRSPIRLRISQGLAGLTAALGSPLRVNDAYADPRFFRGIDEATGFVTRQVLTAPIRSRGGEVLGVLELLNAAGGEFEAEDEELLALLGTQ